MDRSDDIASHFKPLTSEQSHSLLARLAASCWPGGAEDRHLPSAAQWLRLWQPLSGDAKLHVACACATTGRCGVCN
jgi:hypothetical protein